MARTPEMGVAEMNTKKCIFPVDLRELPKRTNENDHYKRRALNPRDNGIAIRVPDCCLPGYDYYCD
jgi:hypothetical protein